MNIKVVNLLCITLLGSSDLVAADREEIGPPRPVSFTEVQQLFNLVVQAKPKRSRFVADVTLVDTHGHPAGEMSLAKSQPQLSGHLQQPASATTNFSIKIQYIQEWYSGNSCRLDRTEETPGKPFNLPANGNGCHNTYINFNDPKFAPYSSCQANNESRIATRYVGSSHAYEPYDLWEALGIDQIATAPLLSVIVDPGNASLPEKGKTRPNLTRADFSSNSARDLVDGLAKNWQISAADGKLGGISATRLQLDGMFRDPAFPRMQPLSSVQAVYWLGHVSGKLVCLKASLTNLTHHTFFLSKREQFDSSGFPVVWNVSRLGEDASRKSRKVVFKEIEISPTFTDEEIFTTNFPNDFSVFDFVPGKGVQRVQSPPATLSDQFRGGIGMMLSTNKANGNVQIQQVYQDSPAAKAGLSEGQFINKIDGIPTRDLSLQKCVSHIRGVPGTKIKLELVAADGSKTNTIELTRKMIQ